MKARHDQQVARLLLDIAIGAWKAANVRLANADRAGSPQQIGRADDMEYAATVAVEAARTVCSAATRR
jgi:hypothetical protein